jgi:hypothetical protein
MCQGTSHFGISRYLQTTLCFIGQSKVFEEASVILNKLSGVEMSGMQIQRVSEYYGSLLDPAIERNIPSVIPQLEVKADEHVYVMVDGSMLHTQEGWKETKLGRVFTEDKVLKVSEKRAEIRESIYVSHLGSVDTFFPKLERHLVNYHKKVIMGDGAKWIWKWAEDNYPGAIQILDFYHAREKLVELSQATQVENERQLWVEKMCEMLNNNQVDHVIEELKKLQCKNDESKQHKAHTISYFEEHEDRMMYKTYKEKGLMIGSGPIEAAHRSVLQSRMKLSGQTWSIKGANAIANLRCLAKSNAWNIVEKIIAAAA